MRSIIADPQLVAHGEDARITAVATRRKHEHLFEVAIILTDVNTGLLGTPADISVATGWQYFFATLPMAIVGLISGIAQGKTAAAAIQMTGKQPDASGKGITMTALVETYAILALLTSILLIFSIK